MTLSQYLDRERGAAVSLARALGVSHSTVSRWASGQLVPSLLTCQRIEEATAGKVRASDFLAQARQRAAAGAA